jgi:Obg family GTPase CgtA
MFVDQVDVHVEAGHGGRGCLAFRRELRVPRGGPSGGDGGHGGSVYVVASPHTNTLINYRFHPEFTADRGRHGEGSNCTGANGDDMVMNNRRSQPTDASPRRSNAEGQRVLVAKVGVVVSATPALPARRTAPRRFSPVNPATSKICASS